MSEINDHVAATMRAVLLYLSLAWHLFPVRPDKRPLTKNGVNDATDEQDKVVAWWAKKPTALIGVRTGAESRLFVLDFDVDLEKDLDGTRWLREMEAEFGPLPKTPRVATPRGGEHVYFNYPEGRMVRNSAGKLAPGVDVRGAGGYVVAPPSEGQNGVYRWVISPDEHAPADAPDWLLDLVCDRLSPPPDSGAVVVAEELSEADLNAVKLLVEKQVSAVANSKEGSRNHTLNKAAYLVGKLVGAKAASEHDVETALQDAAEKVGLPRDEATRTIRSGLRAGKRRPWRPLAAAPMLSDLNREYFFALDGRTSFVFHEDVDPQSSHRRITHITPNAFKDLFGNKFVSIPMPDGSQKVLALGVAWFKWDGRRQYKRIVFAPGKTLPPDVYNQWQGFAAEPIEGDCAKFLAFMREDVCAGDEDAFNYVVRWCARAVQEPASPGQVAIVMRGAKGTGKTFFASHFGELFGDHFVQMSNAHHLVGNFNAHLETAIVVLADEAFWAGDKQGEGSLKTLITSDTIRVERKGIDSKGVPNHVHLIMASNADWVAPASTDERRFMVLDVSSSRAQDHAFFEALEAEWQAGGREAFMHHLLHLNLDGFNVRKVPATVALLEQKLLSLPPIHRWLLSLLRSGQNSTMAVLSGQETTREPWADWVPTRELYDECAKFAKEEQVRFMATREGFGMSLSRLLPPEARRVQRQENTKRDWGYTFPALEVCRAHFEKIIGFKIEWDSDGDVPPPPPTKF